MRILESDFGKLPDGRGSRRYTLTNSAGLVVKITDFGAIITEVHVPDCQGRCANVNLGFDRLEPYLENVPYFGATIGRVANRIGGGRFTLNGREYSLAQNAINPAPSHLHGGNVGFSKVLWSAQARQVGDDAAEVRCAYRSVDGEEGYPGDLDVKVMFGLNEANELSIDYTARTNKPTPINLTNHCYWNLTGAGSGEVLDHELWIAADRYTPNDQRLIPTGGIVPVAGTPLDFRIARRIGASIGQVDGGGYDHNYVLDSGLDLKLAARVFDPQSGRVMEISTTEPAIQFYTSNFLDGTIRGLGGVYSRHGALCLETQHFPDAVNRPEFPSIILNPGEVYRSRTVHRFGVRG